MEPKDVQHKRLKSMKRRQLPLSLAWGITIHKSQGLTFKDGDVLDFAHRPNYQPAAQLGLAFVGMSRTPDFDVQAFRNLPDFWDFRKVLKSQVFQYRAQLEKRMDALHDDTSFAVHGQRITIEHDV